MSSRNDLRILVWDETVKRAESDPQLRRVLEQIGAISFLSLVDCIADAVSGPDERDGGVNPS